VADRYPNRSRGSSCRQVSNHPSSPADHTTAVIANEFGEAANDQLHSGALIAAGLILFILTLAINAIARGLVVRAERQQQPGTPAAALLLVAPTAGGS
jgi:ABC-type phosphate transport system permease subunit